MPNVVYAFAAALYIGPLAETATAAEVFIELLLVRRTDILL
jgi:hypothetical protein